MSHKIELSVTKCYVKMCPCPFLPFFRSLPFYCTILLLSALQLYRISCSKVLGKNGKWVSEESRVLNDPSNRFYDVLWCFTLVKRTRKHEVSLTDDIFETGVYGAPSKSQNPIVLGQGGSSSTQCSMFCPGFSLAIFTNCKHFLFLTNYNDSSYNVWQFSKKYLLTYLGTYFFVST